MKLKNQLFLCFLILITGEFSYVQPYPSNTIKDTEISFVIIVKLDELKLYFKENSGEGEILGAYPIAGPRFGKYPYTLIGYVRKIDLNPYWYPTESIRRDFAKKGKFLPRVVPPGPENPLGVAAMRIDWLNWEWPVVIHGTNDPSSIGRRVSRGCIRLHNEHIMEIINLLKSKGGGRIKVIIES